MSKETAQVITRARKIGFDFDEQFARLLLDEAGGDLDRVVCALEAAFRYAKNPSVRIHNLEGLLLNAVRQGYGRKSVCLVKSHIEEKYADLILNRIT